MADTNPYLDMLLGPVIHGQSVADARDPETPRPRPRHGRQATASRRTMRPANTSAASVPLALDAAVRDGRIKRGDLIVLEAMGGGFTWGAAVIRY